MRETPADFEQKGKFYINPKHASLEYCQKFTFFLCCTGLYDPTYSNYILVGEFKKAGIPFRANLLKHITIKIFNNINIKIMFSNLNLCMTMIDD